MFDKFFINPFCNNDDTISLFACGYGYAPKNYTAPQIRNEYILHSVENGKGFYEVNRETYHLKKGDIFAIYPGENVRYYADENDPWTNCWINFVGKDAKAFLERTAISPSSLVVSVDDADYVKVIQRCLKYAFSDNYTQTRLSAFVLEFLSMIEENNKTSNTTNRDKYTSSAISYMEYYYGSGISASDVSNYLGIERTYFYRIFKAETGTSPTEYLTKLRIEKAKQLISSGDSFAQIASAVGISDIYYFSKLFTKEVGITPSSYRKAL